MTFTDWLNQIKVNKYRDIWRKEFNKEELKRIKKQIESHGNEFYKQVIKGL